jgi:integrase
MDMVDPVRSADAAEVIAAYRARRLDPSAERFAKAVVGAAGPGSPAQARTLLWSAGRLASWAMSVGLTPVPEMLLRVSVIERFCTVGLSDSSDSRRRSVRANLRWLARRVTPELVAPAAVAWSRSPTKLPYTGDEVAAYFALAGAQSTEARRQRLAGLLCLGLGAGIERAELRDVRGHHVLARPGATVVVIGGRRARIVPVLSRYQAALRASAVFAGDGFICGGVSPDRKNLTARLVAGIDGGTDLAALDVGRLRATWLCEQLVRLGVPQLLAAAGVRHSQRIFDLAATLGAGDEAGLIQRLS